MEQSVKVKYIIGPETKIITDPRDNLRLRFFRNKYREVREGLAELLLKDNITWVSELRDLRFEESKKEEKQKTLVIERDYALGDLIMLVPILRHLKDKFPQFKIILITEPGMIEFFEFNKLADIVISKNSKISIHYKTEADSYFNLNGALELDHREDCDERNLHRVDIYAKNLNLNLETYDFYAEIPRETFYKVKSRILQDILKCMKK